MAVLVSEEMKALLTNEDFMRSIKDKNPDDVADAFMENGVDINEEVIEFTDEDMEKYAADFIKGDGELSEDVLENVAGGAIKNHCAVCCSYYYSSSFKWSFISSATLGIHTMTSDHKKAVKAIGYGHRCGHNT